MIILFFETLERVGVIFKEVSKDRVIKIYSQYDPDGIASAAIIAKALIRLDRFFEIRFFKQLNSKNIDKIEAKEGDILVFLDMGSGHLKLIENLIEKHKTFVIDHHEPVKYEHGNLFHINPHLFDVNAEEYCSSILAFLFALSLDQKNEDLLEYMIYGVVGDRKEDGKVFSQLLEKYNNGKIIVENSLKVYSKNKPIHKILAYSFNIFHPEISGNELAAVEFLKNIGINVKNGNEWRTLESLSEDEIKKIVDKLVSLSINPSEIIGNNFILCGRPEIFSNVREVTSMINACSRLNKIEDGFRFCIGDKSVYDSVVKITEEYRKMISEIILKLGKDHLIEKDNAIFIFGKDLIPDTMIGVVSSMYSFLNKNKPIFGISYDEETKMYKVSGRNTSNKNINLRNILVSIVNEIGGEAGGHSDAAGAYIPIGTEWMFVEKVDKILGENNGKG